MDSETPFAIGPQLSLAALNFGNIVAVIFAIIFLWWLIYTLVAIYHWLRYGHDSWIALPALGIHIFVSGWLIFYATSGLH